MRYSLLQAIEVSPSRQLAVVADLLLMHKPRRAIVFTPTRGMDGATYVHVQLQCNTIARNFYHEKSYQFH